MKVRRLQIENFRGIKSLDLSLGDTTVLIGENNSGKTAILDALRFALKDIRSRKGCAFDTYDFHLAAPESEPSAAPAIRIRVTFQEDTSGDWGETLLGNLTRSKLLQPGLEGRGTVIFEVSAAYDPTSKDFSHNWRFLNLAGDELRGLTDSSIATLQNAVSYYYLAALRDAGRHFDPRGPFWRPFLKDSQLSATAKAEIEGKLQEVNDLIVASHDTFSQVSDRLDDIAKVVPVGGMENTVSIEAVPGRLFDMLSKAQVNLKAGSGAKVPLARHGEGTQSLSVLMLFSAFLSNWSQGMPFIAMEEPEAHLHPSAIRALWKLLNQLPGQKIISTHSGDLLSEVPPESVVRLYRKQGEIASSRLADANLAPDEQRKFNFHIRHARGELLFARCWILGEGETEVSLIPEVARALDLDLEQNGVRCIQHRHAGIDVFLKVAKCLGIAVVGICDNDGQGSADMMKLQTLLRERGHSDALFVTPEKCIEGYLCAQGFNDIYTFYLGPQSWTKVKVPASHPDYWSEVGSAVGSKFKTQAAEKVARKIRSREIAVPPILEACVRRAIELTKTF
jgi:putative ATP-dependent endonuclease of OLD family